MWHAICFERLSITDNARPPIASSRTRHQASLITHRQLDKRGIPVNSLNTASKRHWLAQWSGQWLQPLMTAMARRKGQDKGQISHSAQTTTLPVAIEIQLAEMACDLATSQNIQKDLASLLVPFRSWLDQHLHTTDQGLLALLWPEISHPDHAAQPPLTVWPIGNQPLPLAIQPQPEKPFWNQLYRAARSHHLPFVLHQQQDCYLLFPVPLQQDCAWLLIHTHQHSRWSSSNQLQPLLRELQRSLGRGLSGWRQQQLQLQQTATSERLYQAAELHDSVAQVLGYLRMRSAQLASRCHKEELTALQPITDDLAHQCLFAYRQTRELISSRRQTVEGRCFANALQAVIAELEQRSAVVFELDNRCQGLVISDAEATQLLHIVREALCNSVRHAHASHARVRLFYSSNADQLTVMVEDNGRGLPSRQAYSNGSSQQGDGRGGFGLQIMEERARRIAARFSIETRPAGGTRVQLTLNCSRASAPFSATEANYEL
jgi:signal transduction histidine kinase